MQVLYRKIPQNDKIMLCKGFYEENVHDIMLWKSFGTAKNIMLWKIMLGEGLLYINNWLIRNQNPRKFLV